MGAGYAKTAAVQYLRQADPALRRHIDTAGPCTLTPAPDHGPHTLFDRLASSILSQQLSVKAAATIAGRLRQRATGPVGGQSSNGAAGYGARPQLDPARVEALSDEELRACGISRPKVAALRDLVDAVGTGRVPELAELKSYDDDEVIAALTAVRGVGVWTAQMQLIFLLDRPDVFPVADVGVRRGFERVLGLTEKATPEEMLDRSRIWAPYRSVASWYLWRAVDQA